MPCTVRHTRDMSNGTFAHTATVECPAAGEQATAETRIGFPAQWRCGTCGLGLPRLKAGKGKTPALPAHLTRPSWIGNPNPGLGGR